MGVLDDLMRVFGGTMGEMPQAAPQVPDALSQLGGYLGNSAHNFSRIPGDIGRKVALPYLENQEKLYTTDWSKKPAVFDPQTGEPGRIPAFASWAMEGMLGGGPGMGAGARTLRPGIGHNQPPPEYKFPQYAEEYPPVGPPTIKLKESGGTFESKTLTPEGKAFQKERNRIQKDMDANGYEPYFNPAERSYVDPSGYPPPNVDTYSVVPATKKTFDEYAAVIDAPETLRALRAAYEKGLDLGNADHWYAMQQLEKKYISVLGEDAGRAAFLDEFAAPMAATTSGQKPSANLMTAHYLEYLRKRGETAPVQHQTPTPVGGQYAQNNIDDYNKMRAAGGYAGLGAGQPKMHDFSRSFIGDLSHPVIDDKMAGGMLQHAPPGFANNARGIAYGLLAGKVRDEAELVSGMGVTGMRPGNMQDVPWAGFRGQPGKPMISEINDAIERTHRLTGMPREEIVVRGLVKKEIPIYGAAGVIGAEALNGMFGERER